MASQTFINVCSDCLIYKNISLWKWCSDIRADRLWLFFGGNWTGSKTLGLGLALELGLETCKSISNYLLVTQYVLCRDHWLHQFAQIFFGLLDLWEGYVDKLTLAIHEHVLHELSSHWHNRKTQLNINRQLASYFNIHLSYHQQRQPTKYTI